MGKMSNEEKRFSEEIEHLLRGGEAEVDESLSKDYRSTLEFANRMLANRSKPSATFQQQLKDRLLLKLRQQEAESLQKQEKASWFWEGLRNLIPQSPVWRMATVTIAIAVIALVVVWRMGAFTGAPEIITTEPPDTPIITAPPPSQTPLEVKTLQTGDVTIPYGTELKIDLVFRNNSDRIITVSLFPPPICIVQESSGRPVRLLEEGDKQQEILPSEEIDYILTWDQKEYDGEQAAPGWYTVYIGEVTVLEEGETQVIKPDFPPLLRLYIQSP